jgi:hypothetical protein
VSQSRGDIKPGPGAKVASASNGLVLRKLKATLNYEDQLDAFEIQRVVVGR